MNFYDVLAAEKWGGGIPTINFFDLLFAQSMGGGGQWQTYEGALPATINANGDDMRQYQIYGATGGVGDRTVNYFDYMTYVYSYYISNSGVETLSNPTPFYEATRLNHSDYISILPNESYTMEAHHQSMNGPQTVAIAWYDENKNFISRDSTIIPQKNAGAYSFTATAPQNAKFAIFNFFTNDVQKVMFNSGTTPPVSFVPYGYEVDMATGSNILQSSEIEWDGWQAAEGTIPSKIVNPARCRSKNMYPISDEKIFYDFKSLNVNIAFIKSDGRSLGGTGFKTGAGSVDVPANAVKCLFIIANTDVSTNITPAQVIAAGIWASVDATTTPIYIGDEPLDKDEYADYQAGKIYRMINGTLTPTDPPVTLPALPTCEGETVIDYAGQSVAPEKVYFEYQGGE